MIRVIFHSVAFAHFFISLWYDQMYVEIPSLIKPDKRINFLKGRLIFLTLWNMSVSSDKTNKFLLKNTQKMQDINIRKVSFHTFAAIHFAYGCYYDWNYVKVPTQDNIMGIQYAGKLKFLTFWDAVLQTVFFGICIINDLIGSNEIQKKVPLIRKIKDTVFTSLAFPLSMFVGLTFWGLYAIDRELVFPRSLDPFFPVWLNHVMHTNIMIFILIEMLTSFRVYPTQKKGLSVLLGFMLCYLVWMHVVYFKTDVWVYPVMAVLNTPLRICFFLVLLGLSVALYKLGDFLNNKIWKKQIRDVQGKTK